MAVKRKMVEKCKLKENRLKKVWKSIFHLFRWIKKKKKKKSKKKKEKRE